MKLYHNPFSSASFKVRAVIFELGIPCELVTIDMMKGEHKSPEFLAKNPNGKVPTLEDDGFVVWESNAIITYLATRFPEKGLLPTDARGAALVHQWLQWQASQFSPPINKVMMETVYAPLLGRTKNEAKLAEGMQESHQQLAILEKALAGKEYVTGKLSLADFSLVSGLHLRQQMGLELAKYSQVQGWVARLEGLESVRKSLPSL